MPSQPSRRWDPGEKPANLLRHCRRGRGKAVSGAAACGESVALPRRRRCPGPGGSWHRICSELVSKMTLSVIIPCFNERRTIRMIVEKVKAVVAAGTEIIIVNDASTDGTDAIVEKLADEGV